MGETRERTVPEQGRVVCHICGHWQPVTATYFDSMVALQLHEAVTLRCLYVKTRHHSGEHDDRLCLLLGCGTVEALRDSAELRGREGVVPNVNNEPRSES